MKKDSGFTLIELIIIMAMIGILSSIAMYNFRPVQIRNQSKTAVFTLGSALNYAKSEAVTRGMAVTICRSEFPNLDDAPTTPAPACDTNATRGWETGYIVFMDANANGLRDPNEALLRIFPEVRSWWGPTIIMRGTGMPADRITYMPTGFATNMGGTIRIGNGIMSEGGTVVDQNQYHFNITIAPNGKFTVTNPFQSPGS